MRARLFVSAVLVLALAGAVLAQGFYPCTYGGYSFTTNGGGGETYSCYYPVYNPPVNAPSNPVATLTLQSPVMAPYSQQPVDVTLVDSATGSPVRNTSVSIQFGWYADSGGHNHDDPSHPTGSAIPASCTTDDVGDCMFTLQSSYVGDHEAVFGCVTECNGVDYTVKYSDLMAVPSNPDLYTFTGYRAAHPYSHFATQAAINGIATALQAYYAKYGKNPLLELNDSALEGGGWFDLGLNWSCPHQYHSRGTAIDIDLIPDANMVDMVNFCKNSAGAEYAYAEPDKNNVHCEWSDSIPRYSSTACPFYPPGSPPPGLPLQ